MKKILVVEDNEKNMYLMRYVLEKNGYETIEARTGEKGVELASSIHPDLIIMDIKLPGIDGFEAMKQIRNFFNADELPIFAVTSYTLGEDKIKAFEVGCNEYITKPIDTKSLIKNIKKYLL